MLTALRRLDFGGPSSGSRPTSPIDLARQGAGLVRWLRASNQKLEHALEVWLGPFFGPPGDAETFESYARGMTARMWSIFGFACVIINLAAWGLDTAIFHTELTRRALFVTWRWIFLATAIGTVLGFRRIAKRDASPYAPATVLLFAFSGFTYGLFCSVGWANQNWIHGCLTFPLASMLFIVPILPRLGLSVGTACAVLLGHFGHAPGQPAVAPDFSFVALTLGIALLSTITGHGFYVLLIRNFHQRRELARLAYTDSLTGILSRARLLELAEAELGRSRRYARPLSFLILDVDDFKGINDAYGHSAGDEALISIARALQGSVRACDVLGRLGGEEFGIVLPETDQAAARDLAERLRASVESSTLQGEIPTSTRCTVTVGVTQLKAGGEGLRELLNRADTALYDGKRGGRNRVVIV